MANAIIALIQSQKIHQYLVRLAKVACCRDQCSVATGVQQPIVVINVHRQLQHSSLLTWVDVAEATAARLHIWRILRADLTRVGQRLSALERSHVKIYVKKQKEKINKCFLLFTCGGTLSSFLNGKVWLLFVVGMRQNKFVITPVFREPQHLCCVCHGGGSVLFSP